MVETATRVAVQIWPEQSTFDEQRTAWLRAEDLGVDDVFTSDHFFPLSGDPDGFTFETWTLLAAMAEATERARVGTLVTPVGFHNPDLLADMARTVDHISRGCAILGIGAGWNRRDYEEYGYEYGTVSHRAAVFAQAVPRIVSRLSRLNPPPLSDPLPVLIGGGGERTTLRLVAQHAHIWNWLFADPDDFAAKDRVLAQRCAEAGRDPADIVRSMTINTVSDLPTVNDVTQLDQLDEFHAAGIRHVIVGMTIPMFDEGILRRLVTWRDRVNGS